MSDVLTSNTGFVCADCKNVFLQAPRCTTCGAEKLYDTTVRNLQEDNARYENGRVVLTGEIDTLKQKLAYAEDAAAKGDLARQNAGGMDLLIETQRDKIQELEKKLSARLQQVDDLKQLAVRQENEIRKLRGRESA